jgi:hypothetical protein
MPSVINNTTPLAMNSGASKTAILTDNALNQGLITVHLVSCR